MSVLVITLGPDDLVQAFGPAELDTSGLWAAIWQTTVWPLQQAPMTTTPQDFNPCVLLLPSIGTGSMACFNQEDMTDGNIVPVSGLSFKKFQQFRFCSLKKIQLPCEEANYPEIAMVWGGPSWLHGEDSRVQQQ